MLYLDGTNEIEATYSSNYEKLVITAHLNTPVVNYRPIYLDNLLSWSVMQIATKGKFVPDTDDAYWLPLPLKHEMINGLPLWYSSVFMGDGIEDVEVFHKRMISGVHSNKTTKPNVGRHMERRIPVPTLYAKTLSAKCVGDGESVEKLLRLVHFLGKRRNTGMGEINYWKVESADFDDVFIEDGRLIHALPVEYNINIRSNPLRVGWTTPQWKRSLHSDGWPVGSNVI